MAASADSVRVVVDGRQGEVIDIGSNWFNAILWDDDGTQTVVDKPALCALLEKRALAR